MAGNQGNQGSVPRQGNPANPGGGQFRNGNPGGPQGHSSNRGFASIDPERQRQVANPQTHQGSRDLASGAEEGAPDSDENPGRAGDSATAPQSVPPQRRGT